MNEISPILILSQDYELFFHQSGSVEKCLLEPCDALVKAAAELDLRISFFVDAGMIRCMERYAPKSKAVARAERLVKLHIESLARLGHEISLHVHPHWEDVRWRAGEWDFSASRYQPFEFSDAEIGQVFSSYVQVLEELSCRKMTAYRAGGFCVEPFSKIKPALECAEIWVDSSVVPGAYLNDTGKGFDFRSVPENEWWQFEDSVLEERAEGRFLEIPVSVQALPLFYYWGRLVHRLIGERLSDRYGDGSAKKIGRTEVLRRLAGTSRIAELSLDVPKVDGLLSSGAAWQKKTLCHVMGHPKLLSRRSLETLETFVRREKITRSETISDLAVKIRAGEINRASI